MPSALRTKRALFLFSRVWSLVCVYVYDRTRKALRQVQTERPAYASGAPEWWGEVIKRTALGAGADPTSKYSTPSASLYRGEESRPSTLKLTTIHITPFPSNPSSFVHLRGLITFVRFGSQNPVVDRSVDVITPALLKRFSSEEGYVLFNDTMPTSTYLHTSSLVLRRHSLPISTDPIRPDILPYLLPFILSHPRCYNVYCSYALELIYYTALSWSAEGTERTNRPCEQH